MFGIKGIIWWLREKYDHYNVEAKTLIDTKDLSRGSQQMIYKLLQRVILHFYV